jgi:hypothetical protein
MNEYVSVEIWHRIQDVRYHYQAMWNITTRLYGIKSPKRTNFIIRYLPPLSPVNIMLSKYDIYLTLKGKEILSPV